MEYIEPLKITESASFSYSMNVPIPVLLQGRSNLIQHNLTPRPLKDLQYLRGSFIHLE